LDNRYKIKYAFTGNWHILIPVKTKEAIMNVKPDYKKLGENNHKRNVSTTHLFVFDTHLNDLLFTRDFAPAVGVNEDPVTGSANGALAGYLVHEGMIAGNSEFIITQGNSSNRLGKLFIKTSVVDQITTVQVGGKAVIVMSGEMTIV